jgi:hypothetical protein
MISDRFRIINPNDLEDYHDQAGDITEASWPEFMLHDPIAGEHWHELFDRFNARALTTTLPGKRTRSAVRCLAASPCTGGSKDY